MFVKRMVFAFLSVLIVIGLNLRFVHAQNGESALWGIWENVDPTAFRWGLEFTPSGFISTGITEMYASGTYTADSTTIHVDQYQIMMGGNANVHADYHYEISDGTLRLTDQYGTESFKKVASIAPSDYKSCSGNPPSRMIVGYAGLLAFTDGTTTNLRSEASTGAKILWKMSEGLPFMVIGGPVCNQGYTWWQIRVGEPSMDGWVAEGTPKSYFLEPYPYVAEGVQSAQPPVPVGEVDLSYSCGSALQTNLFVGTRAKVTFITGSVPMQLYTEASQTGGNAGSIPEGTTVTVDKGPVCAEDVVWWYIKSNLAGGFHEGWAPEVTSSGRYLVRLTTDTNDVTAVYDPFGANSVEYLLEPEIPLRLYENANPTSKFSEIVWPGTAYKITAQNLSYRMLQIATDNRVGWVCADSGFVRLNDKPLDPLPLIDGNSTCSPQDYVFDTSDLFKAAGATVYQPGQYPHIDLLKAALESNELGSEMKDIVDNIMFVKKLEKNGVDLICTVITSIGLVQTNNSRNGTVHVGDVACRVFEWGSQILHGEVLTGVPFAIAYIVANHEKYIDPTVDIVNTWTDSLPLTRAFCSFTPSICVGGPGSSK